MAARPGVTGGAILARPTHLDDGCGITEGKPDHENNL
jgi:hypothetical protein